MNNSKLPISEYQKRLAENLLATPRIWFRAHPHREFLMLDLCEVEMDALEACGPVVGVFDRAHLRTSSHWSAIFRRLKSSGKIEVVLMPTPNERHLAPEDLEDDFSRIYWSLAMISEHPNPLITSLQLPHMPAP